MFEGLPKTGRRRWNGLVVSLAGHFIILLALLHGPAAVFVTPSDVGLGIPHSLGSQSIIYLAPVGPEKLHAAEDQPRVTLAARSRQPASPHKREARREPPASVAADAPEQTARGGSPFGRVPGSPLTGDEVVPAFPDMYPDPPVARTDLPAGVQGDVIVEVTIDARGNVVEMKLVKGIGYGIEQKVLDALQRWHFHPAMRDGVTIASQHLVHFHYPA